MFDNYFSYFFDKDLVRAPNIVKPNRITGEGRGHYRPLSRHKIGDQKKKEHRKMAKKSRRQNRGS